jgi:hypothetical protein
VSLYLQHSSASWLCSLQNAFILLVIYVSQGGILRYFLLSGVRHCSELVCVKQFALDIKNN